MFDVNIKTFPRNEGETQTEHGERLSKVRNYSILQSFKRICREQRRIDFHRIQIVICISKRQIEQLKKIENTPLLTDNK